MCKSVEVIEGMRNEKKKILEKVYSTKSVEEVYRRQTELNSMAIQIVSEAAVKILPALKEDGVGSMAWNNISKQLDDLSFLGIPSVSEIKEKYKKVIDEATQNPNNNEYTITSQKHQNYHEKPPRGTEIRTTRTLPAFLIELAIQGFVIPVVLELTLGQKYLVLVRILEIVNATSMIVRIVMYFDLIGNLKEKINKLFNPKTQNITKKNKNHKIDTGVEEHIVNTIDYNKIFDDVIAQTKDKNYRELNRWFDNLRSATEKELNKKNLMEVEG